MLVTKDNFSDIISKLKTQSVFILDIESSGLDILNTDYLCGIGIGTHTETFYFPFRHPDNNLDISLISEIFSCLENSIIIGHNIKFDIKGLCHDGFDYSGCTLIDTLVMARISDTERRPSLKLKQLADRFIYNGISQYEVDLKKYMRKNKLKKFSDAPAELIGEYCEKDIDCTRKLYLIFNTTIKDSNQYSLWIKECFVTKTLLNMETKGVKIDIDYCLKCSKLLKDRLDVLENEIHSLVGREFNIDSTKQLTEVMKRIGVSSPEKTDLGNDSWAGKAMMKIDHPVCRKITEYRTVANLKNTFFDPLLRKNSEIVNTSFKNWVAVTGRLSCEEPNLQNIPRFIQNVSGSNDNNAFEDSEDMAKVEEFMHRMVESSAGGFSMTSWSFTGDEKLSEDTDLIAARRLFIPRDGHTLFSFDYTQMEVVVFLYYVKEFGLLNKISNHKFDFHSFIATEALGGDTSNAKTFSLMRQIAKGITFGIIYGMGLNTLSIQIGKSIEEASKFRERYFEVMPKAEKYIKHLSNKVRKGEAIYSDFGRRYCISPEKAYLVINYMIQGSSGDLIKEVMVELDKYLKDKKSSMLVQIHDELLFEISNDELNIISDIEKIMKTNSLKIPMSVDIKQCIGSWASKKEYVL